MFLRQAILNTWGFLWISSLLNEWMKRSGEVKIGPLGRNYWFCFRVVTYCFVVSD